MPDGLCRPPASCVRRFWQARCVAYWDARAKGDLDEAARIKKDYQNIVAATSTLLAASPLVDGVTGRYFEDCQEAEPNQPGIRRGVVAFALDPEHAKRLWEISLGMLSE